MTSVPLTKTVHIDLGIDEAAEWFANLSDDEMCRFLVAVAREAAHFSGNPDQQWYYLGGHLRNCICSSDAARDMIRAWAHWMEHSEHGKSESER